MLSQRSSDGDKDKELWILGDFIADGFKEILLVGKHYSIEVETTSIMRVLVVFF